MDADVRQAIRIARNTSQELAEQAAGTIQDVSPEELISEGCVNSALAALEDARNELLRIQVMASHNTVITRD